MESNEHIRVLIVDDEPIIYEFLEEVVSSWGLMPNCISNPLQVIDAVRDTFYHLILLDVFMPEKSGLDLIPDIKKLSPYTKIIIMTGYADKEIAVKALRSGAFDFLEKPIEMELLSYAVKRALDTQKTELEYKRTLMDLERSQADLLVHKGNLEKVNRQLLETNQALRVLAQNIEKDKEETEKHIVRKTTSLIIPVIENLRQDMKLKAYEAELNTLIHHLENLTSGPAGDEQIAASLSNAEFRIATLIMNGFKTEEISNHLNISSSTVKTHRKNIRKKLGITNQNLNLRNYLESRLGENSAPKSDNNYLTQ